MSDAFEAEERREVRELCERIGYGAVMHYASQAWQTKSGRAAKVVGPCLAFTVECGCDEDPVACDWCCGPGWLTQKVAEAKATIEKCGNSSGTSPGGSPGSVED